MSKIARIATRVAAVCLFGIFAWSTDSSAESLALDGAERWVMIASRSDLAQAVGIALPFSNQKARIVVAQNGWYAIVLGPEKVSTLAEFLLNYHGAVIPDDAILSKGLTFVRTIWTPASRWLELASRQDLTKAQDIAQSYAEIEARVLRSKNGWYAVVSGPTWAKNADEYRSMHNVPLPPDALLVRGANFSSTVWRSERGLAIDSLYHMAFHLYKDGDYRESKLLFEQGFDRGGKSLMDGVAHYYQGQILLKENYPKQAAPEFGLAAQMAGDCSQGRLAKLFAEAIHVSEE
ncbi:hypothetical protein [Mesorhizobium sp. M0207]|uniref:hypothetical protein n=1 Tax=Mesorhizobium sp. M0207 TaxID=2956915 RepID=UPI0033393993